MTAGMKWFIALILFIIVVGWGNWGDIIYVLTYENLFWEERGEILGDKYGLLFPIIAGVFSWLFWMFYIRGNTIKTFKMTVPELLRLLLCLLFGWLSLIVVCLISLMRRLK